MEGGTNHKFPSSVHKVLSNDDLLMEILLRLPILSHHLFKRVCKQWLSLITSPSFILTRTRIPTVDPPSGLFIKRSSLYYNEYNEYDFVSFDPRIRAKKSILCSFRSKAEILQSCNDLLMCYMPHHGEYSIYNPSIRMFKMLPLIHDLHDHERYCSNHYMMAFDPTKSPYYKVVRVGRLYDDESGYLVRIRTYSSETGVWSVWDDLFPYPSFDCFWLGTYWNSAIYWFSYYEPDHVIKLDIVDHPVLTKIQTPLPQTNSPGYYDRKLFKSRDSLLLFCKDYDHSPHLSIYEMKNGYSSWSVKYFVNLDDMMRPYSWSMPTNWSCSQMLSIVLGEQDEDSFMVMELCGKILQYKFVLKTVGVLFDLVKEANLHYCFEYIASFC